MNFQKYPAAARTMIEGLAIKDDVESIAAMTVVTNAIMNLDEFMMK